MDNQFEEFHIGNQLKPGISEPYTTWSSTRRDLDTVTNPPTTQGILELHNKSVKHV